VEKREKRGKNRTGGGGKLETCTQEEKRQHRFEETAHDGKGIKTAVESRKKI